MDDDEVGQPVEDPTHLERRGLRRHEPVGQLAALLLERGDEILGAEEGAQAKGETLREREGLREEEPYLHLSREDLRLEHDRAREPEQTGDLLEHAFEEVKERDARRVRLGDLADEHDLVLALEALLEAKVRKLRRRDPLAADAVDDAEREHGSRERPHGVPRGRVHKAPPDLPEALRLAVAGGGEVLEHDDQLVPRHLGVGVLEALRVPTQPLDERRPRDADALGGVEELKANAAGEAHRISGEDRPSGARATPLSVRATP